MTNENNTADSNEQGTTQPTGEQPVEQSDTTETVQQTTDGPDLQSESNADMDVTPSQSTTDDDGGVDADSGQTELGVDAGTESDGDKSDTPESSESEDKADSKEDAAPPKVATPTTETIADVVGEDFDSEVGWPYNLASKSTNAELANILSERSLTDEEKAAYKSQFVDNYMKVMKAANPELDDSAFTLIESSMADVIGSFIDSGDAQAAKDRELQAQQATQQQEEIKSFIEGVGKEHVGTIDKLFKSLGPKADSFIEFVEKDYSGNKELLEAIDSDTLDGEVIITQLEEAITAFKRFDNKPAFRHLKNLTAEAKGKYSFAAEVKQMVGDDRFPDWDGETSIRQYLDKARLYGVTGQQYTRSSHYKLAYETE